MRDLKIGICGAGVLHTDAEIPDIDSCFRWASEARVFDYLDRTPRAGEVDLYKTASQKYALPIFSSGWYYTLGRDEALLERNLLIARECGAVNHNVQILEKNAAGAPVSNEDVVEIYLRAAEWGERLGVVPCFEVHINMWSEHFGRVGAVATAVEARAVPFNMTLDHSHVIFKIDNPKEQAVQGLDADVAAGRLVLDPYAPGSVCQQWIDAEYVRQMHARPAVPNNPLNIWARHPDGAFGRGVQYPFIKPQSGEWYDDWDEARLEPWKKVVRDLLEHHARSPHSRLSNISLEMIPFADYGGGVKYSILENNIACAQWIRTEWRRVSADIGERDPVTPSASSRARTAECRPSSAPGHPR